MHPERREARRGQDRLRLLIAVVVSMVAGCALLPGSAMAIRTKMLVYTGNGAINEGYTKFSAAASRTLDVLPQLPLTNQAWDDYECAIFPINTVGFTPSDRSAIMNYAARGGTVIALAEHQLYPNNLGSASTTTFNVLASSTGIQSNNTSVNNGAPVTTAGVPGSKYTQGISSVKFGGATTLTLTGAAIPLLKSVKESVNDSDPTPVMAATVWGSGKFVYSGDANVFSDTNPISDFYLGTDNGKLARNLCGDLDPPVLTLTTPAQNARFKGGQNVPASWLCTDVGGVDTQGYVNEALSGTVSGVPIDTTVPAGQVVTKSYTVSCTDKAGNVADPITHQYVVDDRPPTVTIDVPGANSYPRGSAVAASWSCTDPDNDIASKTYVNGALTGTASGDAIDTQTKGTKTFTVTCVDQVGNSASKTVQYTVPNSPPVPTITTPLDGARFTIDKPVTADWLCTDPDGLADINPDENVTFGTTPDGTPVDTTGVVGQTITKTFTVTCTDLEGATVSKTVSYVVDGNPPVVTIAVPLDGGSYPRGSNQPANWSCTDPDGAGDIKTQVATLPVGTPVNTGTQGPKQFSVTCTDQAGNVASKVVTYTVTGGPPNITIVIPANNAVFDQGQVVSASYSCNDPDGDLKSCVREGGATGPIDTSKPGTFKFTVNAADVPGNTATKTVTYTVKAKGTAAAGTSPTSTTKTPAATKVCKSRRQFRIRVKKLRGGVSAVSATVFVNGKKTLTRKGKRVTAIVTLKGLKKGRYTVKINVKYSNGRVLSYTRKFKTCTPKGK